MLRINLLLSLPRSLLCLGIHRVGKRGRCLGGGLRLALLPLPRLRLSRLRLPCFCLSRLRLPCFCLSCLCLPRLRLTCLL